MNDLPSLWSVIRPALLFAFFLSVAYYAPKTALILCAPVWVLAAVTIVRFQRFAILHWLDWYSTYYEWSKSQQEPREDINEA